MPRIGTRRHASMALDIANGTYHGKEWHHLSGGSMRSVFLHVPTGVVYKVERWAESGYDNAQEWKSATALRRLVWEGVYIPKVSLFRFPGGPVLAMEYVEGEAGSRVARTFGKAARMELYIKARFADMHGDNFMFTADGTLVPVDMGSRLLPNLDAIGPDGENVDDRLLSCGDGSCWGIG